MSKVIQFEDWTQVKDLPLLTDAQQYVDDVVKSGKRVSLEVGVNATYSGYLLNRRTYPGMGVAAATPTWVDAAHGGNSPFCAPVLTHHEPNMDPIGRVISAQYHQIWSPDRWENDWRQPAVGKDEGSGFIRLGLSITDQDAIAKFVDKRYLTLSTNFDPASVHCSICGQDVLSAEKLCHKPGLTYDDPSDNSDAKLQCFWIVSPARYKEVSVVNNPAQPRAVVDLLKVVADSEETSTLEHITGKYESNRIPSFSTCSARDVSLMITDSNTGASVALLRKEGEPDVIPTGAGTVRTSVSVSIPGVVSPGSGDDGTSVRMSDEEFAFALIAKSMLDAGRLDLSSDASDKCVDAIHSLEKLETLGHLTDIQKKALKSTYFCGPNRSFPIPDSSYVTYARSLVDCFLGTEAEKAAVLKSINRKAAKLGHDAEKQTSGEPKQETKAMAEVTAASGTGTPGTNEAKDSEALKALADQLAEVRAVNKQLQSERDAKDAEVQRLATEVTSLKDSLHKGRCLQLATFRAITGTKVNGKSMETVGEVQAYADSLASRAHNSIEDSLKDEAGAVDEKLPSLKGMVGFISAAPAQDASETTRLVKESDKKDSKDSENSDQLDL